MKPLVSVALATAAAIAMSLAAATTRTSAQAGSPFVDAELPGSTLAGVVPGPGGLLYGVTYDGGAHGQGTIFAVAPTLAAVTVLHDFTGTDGAFPFSELTAGTGDSAGRLFGTTSSGGPLGGGTVFEFHVGTGTLTTLASFSFPYAQPSGPLLLIGDDLYGATSAHPNGSSLFRVRTNGSDFEVLHVFAADGSTGHAPGALTLGPDGFLYGTATFGGNFGCDASFGCGTAFRLRPDGTDFSLLHLFGPAPFPEGYPQRGLAYGTDGRLYGTTYRGVFSLAPDPSAPDFQMIHVVPPPGSQVFTPPTAGADGRLYVAQYDGGAGGAGAVFSLGLPGLDVVLHHEFSFASGFGPYGTLYRDSAGTIFGTTEYSAGAPYAGTVFALRGANQAPIAVASAPATVAAGAGCLGVVPLDGSASSDPDGDPLDYVWTVGGLVIATGVQPTVSLGVGVHIITLTVTDPHGASDSATVTVEVTGDATLTYTGPALLQQHGVNHLSASLHAGADPMAGAPVTFTVEGVAYPAVTDGAGMATVSVELTGAGAFVDVEVVYAGGGGCGGGASTTVSVPVNRWPIAAAAVSFPNVAGPGCTATVTLNASASSDPDGDPLSYLWTVGGTTLATTQVATVTLDGGDHLVMLAVNDGRGGSDTTTVNAEVRGEPSIVEYAGPLQLPSGVAATLSATLHTAGGSPVAGATIRFTLGAALYQGVTDAAGLAQVAVTAGAVGPVTLRVAYLGDACHEPAAVETVLEVVAANRAPVVQPIADQSLFWGLPLVVSVTATDPDGDDLSYTLIDAPTGAVVDPDGTITWTPSSTQVGAATLTVQVRDGLASTTASFGVSVWKRFTTIVYSGPFGAAPGPVTLTAVLRDSLENTLLEGRALQFTIGVQDAGAVTDVAGEASASFILAQDASTVPGLVTFGGDAAYQSMTSSNFVFRISAPPSISPVPDADTVWGQLLTITVPATDPEGDPLRFALVSGPAGMSVNALNGQVSWIPASAQLGTFPVTVQVTDGISTVATSFAVRVTRRPTSIVDLEPGVAGPYLSATFTATLVDAILGTPLGARVLSFEAGANTGLDTTNAAGLATTTMFLAYMPGPLDLTVTFAGEAAYTPAASARTVLIEAGDADGDGIPDDWEINGLDLNGDGIIDLDLPAMGANPLRKDVFLQLDWMVRPPTCIGDVCWGARSFAPSAEALADVVAAFAAAPTPNPDGSTGITLHIDSGPNSVMDPQLGTLWGAHSRAGEVPHTSALGFEVFGLFYDWSAFQLLKQTHLEPARHAVFHYVVYADTIGGGNTLGISRGIPAADFLIAAGHAEWGDGISVAQERGVFMHELGHNLALRHGGADHINYKPNYSSILNYRWTLPGLVPDGRSDFSRTIEDTIDETLTGDVNGDGRIDLLVGFEDWPHLRFDGGGIGDLFAPPAPTLTEMEYLDPIELRSRGAYARDGDGVLGAEHPWLLAADRGTRSLFVTVTNIGSTAADYLVSFGGALPAAHGTVAVSLGAGERRLVSFPVETTGLVPGEYAMTMTLYDVEGGRLDGADASLVVLDLSSEAARQTAADTAAALAALGPDSGLDPAVIDALTSMLTMAGYGFEGFFSPVRMSAPGVPVWNTARAGRVVPARWRLTRDGLPVTDAASITGLFSQPVSCTSGEPLDAFTRVNTPGEAGLINAEDGHWQLNWTTLPAYRNTCRALVLRLSDGTSSPGAYFRF